MFIILKIVNHIKNKKELIETKLKENIPTRQDRKQMKKMGIKLSDEKAVKQFMEAKKEQLLLAEEQAKAEAKAKEEEERKKNPTETDLLKQILEQLKKSENK